MHQFVYYLCKMKLNLLFLVFWLALATNAQKNQKPFSGELLFSAVRVIPKDSVRESVLLYAKDSLVKVITFSTLMGKQELIKHLGVERSYLLLETSKGKFAVKTDFSKFQDTTLQYSFKKQRGSKRICGIKAKKLLVTFKDIDKTFEFYYFKKVAAKYGSAFTSFPGLVVEYYLPTAQGVYHYTLSEFTPKDPPLTLFMVPDGFKRVTLDEFMEDMTRP